MFSGIPHEITIRHGFRRSYSHHSPLWKILRAKAEQKVISCFRKLWKKHYHLRFLSTFQVSEPGSSSLILQPELFKSRTLELFTFVAFGDLRTLDWLVFSPSDSPIDKMTKRILNPWFPDSDINFAVRCSFVFVKVNLCLWSGFSCLY